MSKSALRTAAIALVLALPAVAHAAAPTATTTPATGITTSSANLNGSGDPNSEPTTGWFRYSPTNPVTCNDSFGTRVPATGGTDLGSNTIDVPYSITTTGLTPGVTYFYCAIVSNASGTAFGAVLSFTIPSAPVTLTTGATSVTPTTAILNGSANPVATATTGWFRYDTTNPGTCNDAFGTRAPTSGGSNLGMGTASVDYTRSVSGLLPGTTYYYCAIASNSFGTTFGGVLFFTTPPTAPSMTTNAATLVTTTSATLNGTGIARGDTAIAWFRYSATSPGSCNDTFGIRVPAAGGTALGSANATVAFSEPLTGLSLATTYYFCAIGQNGVGTSFGGLLTFTTSATAPTVTTLAATGVTGTGAVINANANPNGSSTTGWFRYATTNPGTCNDTFGSRVPASSASDSILGAGLTPVAYNRGLGALTPTTTYYYCALAQNGVGVSVGAVLSFTTPAMSPTVTTQSATATSGTTATLSGTANPNGDATTGYFRYATTNPGTCNDTFGTRAPASGGDALGSGLAGVGFTEDVTGLVPLTTYYYCAIASNGVGTSFGTVLNFTTPAPPTVTTTAASGLTNSSATLNGTANPNRATTSGYFRYATTNPGTCNDTFGSRAPVTGGSNLGAGSSVQSYSQTIGSLSAGVTYYYCAIASNSEGISFGTVLSFTTQAVPTVVTNAATLVTPSSAQLNGTANPNGASATGWYRYATTNPGTCSDSFGVRAPSSGGTNLGAGTAAVPYVQGISGLTPNTTYYACALAGNTYGTSFGAVVSFTTPPAAPTVSTLAPTLLTGTTAQLEGSANPGGDATTAWFRYALVSPGTCNDSFGTRAPTSGGDALGAGTAAVPFNQGITGLAPATTYYYCAIAANGVGTTFGNVVTFVTPAPPTVTTVAASSITNTTAALNGSANPNRATTTGWFRYATTNPGTCDDTFGSRAPTTGGSGLGAGSTVQSFQNTLTGLSPGTTYYFCAIASNSEGLAFGAILTFTTAGPPTVTTNAATLVTASSAQLNGTANPNGATATGWFRYSTTNPGVCSDSFGTRVPTSGGTNLGAVTTPVAYVQGISGLTPATTYYVCAIASNTYGPTTGAVVSFTTPAIPPTVSTLAPSPFTGTTATFNANVNPNGDATTGWFRFSTASPGTCNDTFGTRAPATGGSSVGAGITTVAYNQGVTGLVPNTTYYVCAIASNGLGTSLGGVVQFTTAAPPTAVTVSATSITNVAAFLNGSGNPNRATTTGYFRYATTNPGTCDDSFGTRAPATGGSSLGAGSTAQPYSQSLTGLSPDTTYWYCAITQSTEGTAFGAVLTFTTLAAPAVVTSPPTLVTATSATLNGTGDPNGATATGYFRYATVSPGVCNDSFGTRAPATGGTNLGAGTLPISYGQSLLVLTPNTTYYYCAIANNTYGTSFGAVVSFTTSALPPTVTTFPPSAFTGTTATLSGTANPNGDATTAWFRYATASPGTCNDTFGTRAPATGGTALGSGTSVAPFTQGITGLTPGTTYYVCAIAQNALGTSFGGVVQFTTAAPPVVTTGATTTIAATTATLNGTGNPNRSTTTGYFRYATTNPGTCDDSFGTRAPATGGTNLGNGSSAQGYSVNIAGLTPATTYYVCAIATNAEGLGVGVPVPFTTTAIPTVTTTAATLVTTTSTTLNGNANPNGSTATGYFRFSLTNPGTCNDSFGTRTPATGGTNLGAGTMPVSYSQSIGGLLPGNTYYYCAIANNAIGTGFGAVLQVTTNAGAPSVSTQSATGITTTTATLNGSANPNGASTSGWFRIATTSPGTCNDTFGTRVPGAAGSALGAGNTSVTYSEALTTLTPGTTYYYCAIAQNAVGLSVGSVVSFATPQPPTVVTLAATPVTATTATINAAGNPNGFATTGWFRYSTVDPGTCNDTFGIRAPTTGGSGLGAGTAFQNFSQPLIGLAPATTYYFCAIASSSIGTTLGEVLAFTTPTTQPTVTTLAASGVVADGATLEGTANPNGETASGHFRYATTNPGTCNDSFGTRVPAAGGTPLGAGNATVPYNQPLTGLAAGTTYYYCAIASNPIGTGLGTIVSFTTAAAPTVTTVAASGVASTTATLNGSANPNQAAATGYFRYDTVNPGTCNDTFGTRAPATGGSSLGAGAAPVSYSQPLTGLAIGTTYYFCAIATNSNGTRFGSVLTFTTTAVPTVTTDAATLVTGTTATINGSANPNGSTATGWFRYATTNPGTCNDTFGTRTPTTGGTALGTGTAPVAFNRPLTGLTAGTTYYYCAIASNATGTGFGTVGTFITAGAPTVVTDPASAVSTTAATLNGTATPNQLTATGWFRYATTSPGSCNDTFGTRTPATGGAALGAGTTPVPYSQTVSTLTPGVTYFYCAIASNSSGTRFGTVQSFTTPAGPAVTTVAASSVTPTTASLNGSANPNANATTGYFRYATTNPGTCNDSFGTRAPMLGGTALGSGTAALPYSEPLTGLTSGTTYYFCAIAQNAIGTGFGAVLSFTTPGAPTVTTTAATAITSTTASLNGNAIPNLASTTGYFRYSPTDPGTCDDTFGTRAPATGGSSLGAGTTAVNFTQPLTGLAPGTTYYACAIATNANGTRFGAVLTFTTLAVPVVTTDAATLVTSTTATLNGTANPNQAATTGWFRYATTNPGTCNDTFGTRAPTTGGTAIPAGSAPVAYSRPVTGLAPATTYYYCAIASNSVGTAFGSVMTFTTLAQPSVTTIAASLVTSSAATLNGTANPNLAATTGYFRYATTSPGTCNDTFGTRAPATGGTDLGAGSTPTAYSQGLTGLASGTTYFYCAIAQNAVGTGFGAVLSFTTAASPTVTTSAATSVTGTSAILTGSANPNLSTSTGYFRYASTNPGTCDDTFGTRAPATGGTALGAGSSPVAFSEPLTGLTAGTTYYYCALATNASGTGVGAVLTFTTPGAPTVTTAAATAVTGVSATLGGSATPNLAAATGYFRYSATDPGACDDTFGTRAPATGGTSLGAGTTAVAYTQAVAGLTPGTTYYYCAIASNSIGTRFGAVLTFTTAAAPTVTTEPATAVMATGLTLEGTANPNRAATTGYFRWSATDPGTCDDTFGTRVPATGGVDLGAGATAAPFDQAVTGLAPATTYYYCAIAVNAVGTGFGAVQMATTATAAPTVTTNPPTEVMDTSATLNGAAVPNGDPATGYFRYATVNPGTCNDTFGTRAPATGGTDLGGGTTSAPYTQAVTGLTDGMTYYYCAIATNAAGTGFGAVQMFVAGGVPPDVTTEAATAVTTMGATVAGTANPNGTATTGYFRYGDTDPGTCDDGFGTRAPATGGIDVGLGTTAMPFSLPLTGLEPARQYYYCAAAANVGGAAFGQVRTFTTAAVPPTIRTLDVTPDGADAVTLHGAGNPNGSASVAWFRYDTADPGTCNDTFGTRVPPDQFTALGAGRTEVMFALPLGGLEPGTYFVCALASNAAGMAVGEVVEFEVTGTDPEEPGGGCCSTSRDRDLPPLGTAVPIAVVALFLVRRRRRR